MPELLSRVEHVDNTPEVEPLQSLILLEVLAAVPFLTFLSFEALSCSVEFDVALDWNEPEDKDVHRDENHHVHDVLELLLRGDDCSALVDGTVSYLAQDVLDHLLTCSFIDFEIRCFLSLESDSHGSLSAVPEELVLLEVALVFVGQKVGLGHLLGVAPVAVPLNYDDSDHGQKTHNHVT